MNGARGAKRASSGNGEALPVMVLHCNAKPIQKLQRKGRKVLMIGDGLNDAAALKQSDAGFALSSHINNFSPACDAILLSNQLTALPLVLDYARSGIRIVIISFMLSLIYNTVGLWFAVQGNLSPVIAAILMPISTTSLVAYTVLASSFKARKLIHYDKNHHQAKRSS